MAERDPFDLVEMSPGAQPPSGFGDRILVGLALIAIVAGAIVAVANLLPEPTEVAEASAPPSEEPSRTPRPSPTQRSPRVATLQDPDIGPEAATESYSFDGWIRASVDLVIRADPELGADERGILTAGEVAYASQGNMPAKEPGWLFLGDVPTSGPCPGCILQGWVATIADGEQLTRRYEYPRVMGSGWIESVIAGPNAFVAMFTPPGRSYVYQRPAVSTDGARWQSGNPSAFDGWSVGEAAWGPSGWLAAAGVSEGDQQRILIWSSPDGLSWSRLGMLGELNGDSLGQLIGSGNGYLLETYPQRGGYQTLWWSADGLIWTESTDGIEIQGGADDRRLAAVAGGFYMWDNGLGFVTPGSVGAFSVDGSTWSGVKSDGPNGVNLQLADIQDRIVAIDLDRTTLDPRVWRGSVADGRMVWERLGGSDEAFAGGVVTKVVSDGKRVFAFGWDWSTEQPLVWTGNGVDWVRERLPETFGGLPRVAAAGPRGVVVLGYRHTLRGDNPIAWHRTSGGSWLPEPDPLLTVVPDPATDECAPLPTEFLEFIHVDSAAVISCYGDAPITFEAFSVRCDDCSYAEEGNPQPAWLLNPGSNQLFLSPQESSDGNWWSTGVLGPGITREAAWIGKWIEVTGHFDDPAAATCRSDVTAESVSYWSGLQAYVDRCRLTFVVTEVTVLSPP